MAINVRLSSELKDWITHNLNRGCAPAALVESMVGQNFDPQVARGLIDAFVAARADGMPPPEGSVILDGATPEYRYETPRLPAGNVVRAGDREVRVLLRLERPVIAVLEGVLSAQECGELIEMARPRLQPSTVVDPQTGTDSIAQYRNSEGMFFRPGENDLICRLDRRISQLMSIPAECGEGLQVLRYGPGGHTAPHFDFLIPTNPTNVASINRSGQRVGTLMVYLNDVLQGGETVFPEVGLAVCPRQGNALYFEYANSRQQLDARSLHAGAPVIEGEKWAVTKWMRARRFVPASA
jgi:prolyl 4-hydroxylase